MRVSDVAWVLTRLAEAVKPRPRLPIPEWVEANLRIGADSNSPLVGPINLSPTCYVIAPLSRLDPSDPCREVNVLASAQSGKSLIGQCWIGYSVCENPGPIGVYLPSLDDARKYAEEKVQSIIDASPPLKHRVRSVSSRSNEGSSAMRKRFGSGSLRIATSTSPHALQLVSFRDLILEEIAGYLPDVGGRGSPITQAKQRLEAWKARGAKTLQVSAAGVQGACPSTKAHEDGTAHEIYLECPHCAGFNRWEWEDMNAPSDKLGVGAHFSCKLCGGLVEDHHREAAVAAHVYVATYEDRDDPANPAPPRAFPAEARARWAGRTEKTRQPSYRWWRYVSPFTTWDTIWEDGQAAKKAGIAQEKTFFQQVLARAWDEGRDAPDHVQLFQLREEYPEAECPAGAYLLTGMADVQGDRLHWAVYAWAPGAEWWLIERDIIPGDPAGADVWKALGQVAQRRYPHAEGGEIGIELFGVDAGYKSNHVYAFCSRHPTARAMDGRPGWSFPYLGKPKRVVAKLDGRRVGATMLYPTGTWSLKSELQYSLRKIIESPPGLRIGGRGHFHQGVDENYIRELVAETLTEETARGKITRAWKLRPGFRNEETDIWVGARALAFGLGVGSMNPKKEFDWEAARQAILGVGQSDFFAPQRIQEGRLQERMDEIAEPDDAEPAPPSALPPPPLPPPSGWRPKHTFTRRPAA